MKRRQMISIIVPVYNASIFLPRCLDSILQQTYTDFELLLIDDGSTDSSGEICDRYCRLDKRCKVIHQKNRGTAAARNTGLKLAAGEYITFVDNDDWIHPQYLEYLYNAINSGTYSLAMVQYKTVKDTSGAISNVEYITDTVCRFSMRSALFDSVDESGIPYIFVWAKLYKRELLDGLYFKDIIGEDVEFSFHVNSTVQNVVLVKGFLYYWLQHSGSQFRNQIPARINSSIDCYFNIFNEIAEEESQVRGLCLKRLWLTMLSARYVTDRLNEFHDVRFDIERNIKFIVKTTRSELMSNKFVPLPYKIMLPVFYYIPFSYRFFRRTMELRNKLILF